jgi:hypothetical protein
MIEESCVPTVFDPAFLRRSVGDFKSSFRCFPNLEDVLVMMQTQKNDDGKELWVIVCLNLNSVEEEYIPILTNLFEQLEKLKPYIFETFKELKSVWFSHRGKVGEDLIPISIQAKYAEKGWTYTFSNSHGSTYHSWCCLKKPNCIDS